MVDDREISDLVTVTEKLMSVVRCVTRFSNPAPVISWSVSGDQLPVNSYNQTDTAEQTAGNKVMSESVLVHQFSQVRL